MKKFKEATAQPGAPADTDLVLWGQAGGSGLAYKMTFTQLKAKLDAMTSGDVTAPTVVSAETASDDTIQIVFDETMGVVSTAGWSFEKNGSPWTLSSISGSGDTYNFEMASAAVAGDTLTWSYDASTGGTQDVAANELGTQTDQAISNTIAGMEDIEYTNTTINVVLDTSPAPSGMHFTSSSESVGTIADKKLSGSWSVLTKLKTPHTDSGLVQIYLTTSNTATYEQNNAGETGIKGGFTTYLGDIGGKNGPDTQNSNGFTVATGVVTDGMYILMDKSGDDLNYYTSPDGVSFTLQHSDVGQLAGVGDLYIKIMNGGLSGMGIERLQATGLVAW